MLDFVGSAVSHAAYELTKVVDAEEAALLLVFDLSELGACLNQPSLGHAHLLGLLDCAPNFVGVRLLEKVLRVQRIRQLLQRCLVKLPRRKRRHERRMMGGQRRNRGRGADKTSF